MKLYSGKRPVMFYQPGVDNDSPLVWGDRIRIFYPNGHAEWCPLAGNYDLHEASGFHFGEVSPCFLLNASIKTMEDAISAANEYDRTVNFPPQEFLGEL